MPVAIDGRPPIDAPWEEIREAIAAGVSQAKVAARFGISLDALKKRCSRHKWFTPNGRRAKQILRESNASQGYKKDVPSLSLEGLSPSKTGEKSVSPVTSPAVNVVTLVAESAQELAESGSMMGARLIHGLLKDASKPEAKLAPLVDVKDVGNAIRSLRLAGGLDKAQVNVGLNLWSSPVMSPCPRDVSPKRDGDILAEVEEWGDE